MNTDSIIVGEHLPVEMWMRKKVVEFLDSVPQACGDGPDDETVEYIIKKSDNLQRCHLKDAPYVR